METETFRERLISAAFTVGWNLVCRLPESLTRALFNFGADIAWRRQGAGVQVLEGNLVRVLRTGSAFSDTAPEFGQELRALSKAVMRSYARYYLETFRLQIIPDEQIVAGMHVNQENIDLTLKHLRDGRGVIYALPHMGDFEQAGRWVILVGAGSITAPAERLKPESVYQKWLKFREGLGMEVVPTTGGPHPFGVMAQRLRAGKLVTIIADRDLSDTGVEVEFFGEKALFPAGPAALALQTGAALMPVCCSFVGETEWAAHIYDEIPIPAEGSRKEKTAAMTQALARAFEHGILEHPEDWHMLQKVFVSDLDPERLARSRARTAAGNGGAGNGGAGNGNGSILVDGASLVNGSRPVDKASPVDTVGTLDRAGAVDRASTADRAGAVDRASTADGVGTADGASTADGSGA